MLPPPYNDVLQIIQTPGYVLVIRELDTAPRLIPTDGRPHMSENIRRWAGDSRGRWEGDTLVVDTTNFTHRTAFQGSSAALHVVERFTRVSADRILYQFTVDDPDTWTRPWSAEIPMIATKGPAVRVCLPRRQLRHAGHPQGRSLRRERGRARRSTPVGRSGRPPLPSELLMITRSRF